VEETDECRLDGRMSLRASMDPVALRSTSRCWPGLVNKCRMYRVIKQDPIHIHEHERLQHPINIDKPRELDDSGLYCY